VSSVRRAAQAQIERRAAVAVLAGEQLGRKPLLWLIREALDAYDAAHAQVLESTRLASVRGKRPHHAYMLYAVARERGGAPRPTGTVLDKWTQGNLTCSYDVPAAAVVLHGMVQTDPVAAEKLLVEIERATKKIDP
jgi:hypothetical protein